MYMCGISKLCVKIMGLRILQGYCLEIYVQADLGKLVSKNILGKFGACVMCPGLHLG